MLDISFMLFLFDFYSNNMELDYFISSLLDLFINLINLLS